LVKRALSWLSTHDGSDDHPSSRALVLVALAEAYGMINDPTLRQSVEQRSTELVSVLAAKKGEVDAAILRSGPLDGPQVLTWCVMALKSTKASGIDVGTGMKSIERRMDLLIGHPDRHAAAVCRLATGVFLGWQDGNFNEQADDPYAWPPVDEWLAAVPRWVRQGRPELLYFATLGVFQLGGERWQHWSQSTRDFMLAMSERHPDERSWAASVPHPAGGLAAAALTTMGLSVYYRYIPVASGGRKAPSKCSVHIGPPPLPDVAKAAQGWPLTWTVGAVNLRGGHRQRLAIDTVALPGQVELYAIPARRPGAWHRLISSNPMELPLPAGPLAISHD
jgi:hypothetical protein